MLELRGVTQHYGVRPVLKRLDLTVERGELVMIVGPNGMGKSTVLRVLAGTLSPQQGTVWIEGQQRRHTEQEELDIRRKVVYLPDHPWCPVNRTGREFLLAVGRLYDVPDERLMEHTDRLLELFDLTTQGDWPIRSYSNGQQKKIAICSALIADTPVLLLDEPFAGGLDPSGILALKHVLRGLVERRQATVVMTTPVPELLDELADRIVVLKEGTVLAYDTPAGLRRLTGCSGSMADVLGRLIHPQTLDRIDRYFEADAAAGTGRS